MFENVTALAERNEKYLILYFEVPENVVEVITLLPMTVPDPAEITPVLKS
jgi:hypothetical protein